MTRRSANAQTRPAASQAAPDWPPTCTQCGFTGAPGPDQTPYAACNGNPTRHQRTPVGART